MQNNIQLSDKILKSFPSRELTLTPLKGDGGIIRTSLLTLVMLAFIAFFIYQIPNIAYDYRISQNAIPVDAYVDGSCKTRLLVITDCDVDLRYQGHSVSHSFTFLGFNPGDIEVLPLADANDPSKLTVDVAVDNVELRFISVIVLILLFIACIIIFIRSQIVTSQTKKALLSVGTKPLKLTAIPAKVVNVNRQFIATYKFDFNGKQKSKSYSGNKKTAPFSFEIDGKSYIFVVYDPEQNIPYVLDLPLKRIQATPEEVQHFYSALTEEGII